MRRTCLASRLLKQVLEFNYVTRESTGPLSIISRGDFVGFLLHVESLKFKKKEREQNFEISKRVSTYLGVCCILLTRVGLKHPMLFFHT